MSTHSNGAHAGDGPIRGWQPLSAEQVRQRTFRETPLGRRGYRPDEVNLYLGRVASDIERWSNAYAAATAEIHRLRNYFRDQGLDPQAVHARQVSAEAVTVLARAQAHADQIIADAQAHARSMQSDARAHAQAIVAHARQEADRTAHAYRA